MVFIDHWIVQTECIENCTWYEKCDMTVATSVHIDILVVKSVWSHGIWTHASPAIHVHIIHLMITFGKHPAVDARRVHHQCYQHWILFRKYEIFRGYRKENNWSQRMYFWQLYHWQHVMPFIHYHITCAMAIAFRHIKHVNQALGFTKQEIAPKSFQDSDVYSFIFSC